MRATINVWKSNSVLFFLLVSLTLSLSLAAAGCLSSQREALLSALSNGERWQDVISLVEAMLAKLLVVDNPTAGLAMKAYANLGLQEHWKSVSFSRGAVPAYATPVLSVDTRSWFSSSKNTVALCEGKAVSTLYGMQIVRTRN